MKSVGSFFLNYVVVKPSEVKGSQLMQMRTQAQLVAFIQGSELKINEIHSSHFSYPLKTRRRFSVTLYMVQEGKILFSVL